jgi:outer membrane protein assembly factor BamE (lipoprotein component of BamABCDE complex)
MLKTLIQTLSTAAAAVLLLAGCDQQRVARLEEGVATEADVRREFGEPVDISVAADGSRTFDYPRQPEGQTNYFITIGPDGKMSALRQLLHPDNFAKVVPGTAQADVRALLGRPARIHRYDLKPEQTVWDWRYRLGQASKVFSVTFDPSGLVIGSATSDDPVQTQVGGN